MDHTLGHGRISIVGEIGSTYQEDSISLSMPPSPTALRDLPPGCRLMIVRENDSHKKRGRTTLQKSVLKLKEGERYKITLSENGKPIKGEVTQLSLFIGIEARDIPCTYDSWLDVPKDKKVELYEHVKEKFDFGERECFQRVNRVANTAWKREKKLIRTKVLKGGSLTDALAHMPFGCKKDDWERTCIKWFSESYAKLCKSKRDARSKVQLRHKTGCQSFDYVQANASDQEGETLFNALYKGKKGRAISVGAKALLEKIEDDLKEMPPNTTEVEKVAARKEAFMRLIKDGKKKTRKRIDGEDDLEIILKEKEKEWNIERAHLLGEVKAKDNVMKEYQEKTDKRLKLLEQSIVEKGVYRPHFVAWDDPYAAVEDNDETQAPNPADFEIEDVMRY